VPKRKRPPIFGDDLSRPIVMKLPFHFGDQLEERLGRPPTEEDYIATLNAAIVSRKLQRVLVLANRLGIPLDSTSDWSLLGIKLIEQVCPEFFEVKFVSPLGKSAGLRGAPRGRREKGARWGAILTELENRLSAGQSMPAASAAVAAKHNVNRGTLRVRLYERRRDTDTLLKEAQERGTRRLARILAG
jgi:hypothetical protein